jgi:pimeloyl-ACP methyl ester carboxylesterase
MGRRLLSTFIPIAVLVGACSAGSGAGPSSGSPIGSPGEPAESTEPAAATVEAAGRWQGQIQIPGAPLDVGVTFTGNDGGTFDVPSQGLSGARLTGVSVDGSTVAFGIAAIPGNPSFTGEFDGQTISGRFSQNGRTFPLTLSRGAVEQADRPQEPQPPHPYESEDVTYQGGVTVAGTLTRPDGEGPFPAVLLITGSGAQDRDETIAGHKPFLLIADTLTRAGCAVLRVDDRGVGGTGGVLADSTYDDLAADVTAGLQYLRSRPDIRAGSVGLLGHSEGGYLAPLVAQTQPAKPDFVMLMAGPAMNGKDLLIDQNRVIMRAAGSSQPEVDAQVDFVTRYADLVVAGDFAAATELARQRVAEAGGSPDAAPDMANEIMRSLLSYDPAPALQSLTVPVLAVFGGKDLQVPAEQNEPIMRELLAGNPDATVQTMPNLNHLMQPATTGLPTEYAGIATTIDPSVLDLYVSWLRQRFPAG